MPRLTFTAGPRGNKYTKLTMFIEMVLLKYLYMISISLMLSDNYLIWSFDKHVDMFYSFIELVPFIVCLLIYLHGYRANSAYSFFSTLLFIMFFIPSNSGLSLSANDPLYYCLINVYAILIFLLISFLTGREGKDLCQDRFEITRLYESKGRMRVIRVLLIVVCVISIAYVYFYNGLDFSALFSDMYETRADYAAYVAENTDSLLSYFLLLFSKMTQWLLPLCFYFALVNKKPIDVFLCLFSFLALFTVSMEKSTLLIVAIVAFIYWAEKHTDFSRVSELIIRLFIAFFAACLIEYSIRGESILFTMIVRRMFYIPTYLTKIYYDFYSVNSKMWFTQDIFFVQNILQSLVGRAYPTNSTQVISSAFFDGLIPSPNTGMFAEAYGQMGVIGTVVFPFIVCVILWVMRRSSDWYGDGAVAVIMTRLCLQMISTSILPSSAFIGVLLMVFVTFLLKNYYRLKNRDTYRMGEIA